MIRDITIIGGGPTGLFALFYAGMRGATAQIIDALPEPGLQLAVNQAVHWIYPEKKVAPGHSSNLAVFGQKAD